MEGYKKSLYLIVIGLLSILTSANIAYPCILYSRIYSVSTLLIQMGITFVILCAISCLCRGVRWIWY